MIDIHYVSINIESGISSTAMKKAPLGEVLKEALQKAPESKNDCWLMSNGYKDTNGFYTREEWNFQWIDTILIDCDNGKDEDPSTWDVGILDKFKDEFGKYAYFMWETFSSKPERPKFRAIILLDRRIEWVNEPAKFTKEAIKQHFAKYTDANASWFFTPPKGKVSTFAAHKGIPYPSANIEWTMNSLKSLNSAIQHSIAHDFDVDNLSNAKRERNPDGWRFLPTVKKCLDGMSMHTKHNSICSAVYAMEQCGYHDEIPTFLNEVSHQITKKHHDYWYSKWKRNNV